MAYLPKVPPAKLDPASIMQYIQDELVAISRSLQEQTELQLVPRNVEPSRPREGMIVMADGVNWDPGSGKGAYLYSAGAWAFLG